MSDVTVAPNASPAPSAPAAAPANEAVVNQNQTTTPSPVGSQAPDKPVEQQRSESRRESIQRAFDKSRAENPPQAAKPRIGHNNPPEAVKPERPKLEPINLKQRPSDQSQPQASRGEHGHFAPREQNSAQNGASGAQNRTQLAPSTQPGQQHAPGSQRASYDQPLPRMSQQAKTDWMKVPETVRADVHRLHTEFGRAYQQYRGDHETMNTIRPFAQMAQQHGTTLERALSNYVGMEHKLRSDVVGGLDIIINNLNLRTPDGQKLTLPDVAWHIVNQTPEQRKLLQSQNTLMAQSHQLDEMRRNQQVLAQHLQRMHYEKQFTQTRSAVDQFADAHPRLDELGDLIEQEVKLGFDLDTAYQRADRLRPATHAAQTRSTTAQTRPTDRSISGAPSGPSNGSARRSDKPVGRREAIANAIKRVGGSL